MTYVSGIEDGIWRTLAGLGRRERGVTGLETAIILIAFVVVASVFAFTVLSTGIFSAERSRETVFAGLNQARGAVDLKGSVIAKGVPSVDLSDAESAWTPMANVTTSVDTTVVKQGAGSALIQVTDPFTTGLVAYESISPPIDLSGIDSVSSWVWSDLPTGVGDLQLVLSESAGCLGTVETLDIPALGVDDPTLVIAGITDTFDRDAIVCVGLIVTTDQGAQTIHVDDFYARGQATELIVTLANAVGGEAIDLSEPSDSDGDGIADAENRSHQMVITYQDSKDIVNDLFWSRSFVGSSDGDDLLETGEKAEVTISFEGLAQVTPLTENEKFAIEIKPAEGAVLPIQRTMPGQIGLVMNLN